MGLRDRAAQALEQEHAEKIQHREHCWKKNAQEAEQLVLHHLELDGKTVLAYSMTPDEKSAEYHKRWNVSRSFGWGDDTLVEVVEEDITLMVKVLYRSGYDNQGHPTTPGLHFLIVRINGAELDDPYKAVSLADVGRAIERHDQQQGI